MSPITITHFKNGRSLAGLAIALVTGVLYVTIFLQELTAGHYNPYLDVVFYFLLPPVLILGLWLVLSGVRRTRKRLAAAGIAGPGPSVRWSTAGTLAVAALFATMVVVAAFAGYSGYHYSESVSFCGTACHVPMKPTYVAHQFSPHASVDCAKCHVGEGAASFLRSKLAGTRQLAAVLTDSFDRPIPTPVKTLRPESETCLRCHWREMSFGSRVVSADHFGSDEKNTRKPVALVLRTGGGDPRRGAITGIHWHSDALHQLEYIATDEKRNVIPWVRVTTAEGSRVFRSDGLPSDAPPPEGELRFMDCMDCHNRPAHQYRTPDAILNNLFASGYLDASLPFLKRESARLMAAPYETTPEATAAIADGLRSFYEKHHPEIVSERNDDLGRMIGFVQDGFERNIFPEMKTDWRSESDHIGHKYYPGCFRCHDDRHKADDGAVIPRKCQLCHDSLTEVPSQDGGEPLLVRGEYHHPFRLENSHGKLLCSQCHSGGPTPPPTCAGCHTGVADFRQGLASALPGFHGEPDARHGAFDCTDCHESGKHVSRDDRTASCLNCHEEEFLPQAEKLFADLEAARRKAEGATGAAKATLDRLDALGPFHNPDLALEVLKSLEPEAARPQR